MNLRLAYRIMSLPHLLPNIPMFADPRSREIVTKRMQAEAKMLRTTLFPGQHRPILLQS